MSDFDKDHQILVVGRPKICPTNPKWRTAAILKKWINCYISATVRPISTKFCMLMHIGPPNPKKCSKIIIITKDMCWVLHLNLVFDRFKC